MHQHLNPFIQHAVWHGQVMLAESNRAASVARDLVAACDNIIFSVNSGNIQGAVTMAQNARNMAVQVADSTQELNRTLSERIEMASYVLTRIQLRINELAGALNSLRGAGYQAAIEPWQYGATLPYQQQTPIFM